MLPLGVCFVYALAILVRLLTGARARDVVGLFLESKGETRFARRPTGRSTAF